MADPQLSLDQDYYASPGTYAPAGPAATWQPVPVPASAPSRRYGPVAVLLAILPGIVFLFGAGHFYAGRWRAGLVYLLGYWAVMIPMTILGPVAPYALLWLALLIWTPISAARAVRRRNLARGLS